MLAARDGASGAVPLALRRGAGSTCVLSCAVVVWHEETEVLPGALRDSPGAIALYAVRRVGKMLCHGPCSVPRAGLSTVLVSGAGCRQKLVHDSQADEYVEGQIHLIDVADYVNQSG